MIRFVHVGRDIYCNNDPSDDCRRSFSFYDTSSDKYVTLHDSQMWMTWKSFVEDLPDSGYEDMFERFKGLTPDWILDPSLPMPSPEEQYD